jgi:sorbose reductase
LTVGLAGSSLSLRGRVSFITGGATGIGWHVARAFAEAGSDVAIAYNTSEDKAREAVDVLQREYGIRAMKVWMPATDAQRVEEAVEEVLESFKKLDVVRG